MRNLNYLAKEAMAVPVLRFRQPVMGISELPSRPREDFRSLIGMGPGFRR